MDRAHERGISLEKKVGKVFHSEGVPVLVSSQVLRSLNAGQIDLCRIRKVAHESFLELAEVKASERLKYGQKKRLDRASDYLSKLFSLPLRRMLIHWKSGGKL